jgi:hypothetical protein
MVEAKERLLLRGHSHDGPEKNTENVLRYTHYYTAWYYKSNRAMMCLFIPFGKDEEREQTPEAVLSVQIQGKSGFL